MQSGGLGCGGRAKDEPYLGVVVGHSCEKIDMLAGRGIWGVERVLQDEKDGKIGVRDLLGLRKSKHSQVKVSILVGWIRQPIKTPQIR